MDVFDKFTLEKIGRVKNTTAAVIADLNSKISEAAVSYEKVEMDDRKAIIEKLSSYIETFSDDLAALVTSETGKPIGYSRIEVASSVDALRRMAAGLALQAEEKDFSHTGSFPRNSATVGSLIFRAGYMTPALDFVTALGIGLSTGMGVVFVPHGLTPLSAGMISEKVAEALPAGLINLVNADNTTFNKLLGSVHFETFGFSGKPDDFNNAVKRIGVMNYFSNLHENYPVIIWEEENVDSIVEEITASAFYSGSCYYDRAWKVIVKKEIMEYVKNRIVEISGSINVGDPRDPLNSMGPVTDSNELLAASVFSTRVKSDLGEVAMGGKIDGNVMSPTLVIPEKKIGLTNTDIGAPLTLLMEADSIEDAIHMANNLLPGSKCVMYTNDIEVMKSTVPRLNYASVHINSLPEADSVISMSPMISHGPIAMNELKPRNRLIL